jgi:hypothetical protein
LGRRFEPSIKSRVWIGAGISTEELLVATRGGGLTFLLDIRGRPEVPLGKGVAL